MGRCSVLVANERNPGRERQRKLGWLLLLKEEGWQMCSKELWRERCMALRKWSPLRGRADFILVCYPAFVLTVEFLAEKVLHQNHLLNG